MDRFSETDPGDGLRARYADYERSTEDEAPELEAPEVELPDEPVTCLTYYRIVCAATTVGELVDSAKAHRLICAICGGVELERAA